MKIKREPYEPVKCSTAGVIIAGILVAMVCFFAFCIAAVAVLSDAFPSVW